MLNFETPCLYTLVRSGSARCAVEVSSIFKLGSVGKDSKKPRCKRRLEGLLSAGSLETNMQRTRVAWQTLAQQDFARKLEAYDCLLRHALIPMAVPPSRSGKPLRGAQSVSASVKVGRLRKIGMLQIAESCIIRCWVPASQGFGSHAVCALEHSDQRPRLRGPALQA